MRDVRKSIESFCLGCKVAIASRNIDRLNETAKELSVLGDISTFQCNIREENDVEYENPNRHLIISPFNTLFCRETISKILDRYGDLNFLVNNGGGQFLSGAENISLKGWKAVIETNLTGTFLVSKEGTVT